MLPGFLALLAAASVAAKDLPPANENFADNIQRVFSDDRQADIRVIFGYDNYEDMKDPNDPGRARNLMDYLTNHSFTPVTPTQLIADELGVPLDARNLRIFEGPGQWGFTLRVSLIWSSATSSTAKNIGSEYPVQLRCSETALKFMQRAASDAEVMVYIGHSRAGGGPDTFPPETLQHAVGERQQVDFSHYRSTRPGLSALGPYFLKARNNPHFIVWTGCFSDNHFRSWFARMLAGKTTPTSLVLSTRYISHKPWKKQIEGCDEALMVLVSLIEALQQVQPQAVFEERLKACEMDLMRNPLKPAWKLTSLPGARASRPATVTVPRN